MTYEYALQRVKGIKKSFDNAMVNAIDKYKDNRIIDIYPNTEAFSIFTSTEGMSGSKKLGPAETPPVLSLQDGYSVQIEENRFGGAIELLENEYRREANDGSTKVATALKRKRNGLLIDNKQLFLREMFKFLNYAFVTTAYAAPDGKALFADDHAWAGGGTFDNKGTSKLSISAIDALEEYGGAFINPDGKENPLDFDTIIVKKGSENSIIAKKLFANGISPIHVADINIYEGSKTIIETPYISYANRNNWFARASQDPNGNPLQVGVGEYPTLREPIKQNNEAIRTNCTGFWLQGIVNMPYSWFGSTGES